jgi:6-phosphogluconolactonase/glucosamine-6-phosphate isomerase/deaminase
MRTEHVSSLKFGSLFQYQAHHKAGHFTVSLSGGSMVQVLSEALLKDDDFGITFPRCHI